MAIACSVMRDYTNGNSAGNIDYENEQIKGNPMMAPEAGMAVAKETAPASQSSTVEASRNSGEAKLLLEAFEIFTQASGSLELAFNQLQARARFLTEELEAKNIELQKSLREKEEAQNYLRTILERLPCGVFVLDKRGDLALCNPMAFEVLEQSWPNHPGSNEQNKPFLSPDMRNHLAESVALEKVKDEVEIPFFGRNKKRILATSGAPLADAAGHRIGTLHIIRDITEMKALQEQNKRIERLSAMGEMAVELAHEIRNPLGSIELFASLLAKELSGDPKRWAENIQVGSQSLNNIVTNMLHFANPLSPDFSEVNIHDVILEVLKFADPIMNQRNVGITKHLDAEDPRISADGELLKQMMLNLILNAMKAMPSQGSLTIVTRNIERKRGCSGDKVLELQIKDTGIGIAAENLGRIFDPFFTTNKNGTGLGLSVVHQIVQRHGGKIRVSSEINRGTVFTISFRGEREESAAG
jgi:PAS domain S-box-containing protein